MGQPVARLPGMGVWCVSPDSVHRLEASTKLRQLECQLVAMTTSEGEVLNLEILGGFAMEGVGFPNAYLRQHHLIAQGVTAHLW